MNTRSLIPAILLLAACGSDGPPPRPSTPPPATLTAAPSSPTPTPTPTSSPTAPTHPPATSAHAVLPASGASRGSLFDLDLTLEDHRGQALTLRSFEGTPLVISMFYAKCGYACPTLVQDIQNLERALSEADRAATRVLLVTFDPEADTPAVLLSIAERHAVDTTRWTFARAAQGGDEATRELAGALGIKYRRLDDGHYNHSTLITLLDRRGVPLARIDGLKQDTTAFRAIVSHAVSEPR